MPRTEYAEIKVFRDPDGVCAVISEHRHTKRCSYAFFKEYEVSGEKKRTTFLNRRHSGAVRRLIRLVEDFIDRKSDREYEESRAS